MKKLSKFLFFVCVILVVGSVTSHAQELKKKLRGKYTGIVPSYTMQVGERLLEVSQAQVSISFVEGQKVLETIGSSNLEGTYRITSETKTTITLQVNYPDQIVYEELVLNKKDKTLIRKGFYPQPESRLSKEL